jgi:molybdopterin/thiamine biosynthesis adenylyltransferase
VRMEILDESERTRYSRQISIKEFGEDGQRKLKNSHVVIAGVGGLGCASASYLVAAGVGHVTLIDNDNVKLSNLNRQVLYRHEDIDNRKVNVAAARLSLLNPYIKISPVFTAIEEDNVNELIRGAGVVVDGLDNLKTRLLINRACIEQNIPYIYGGVSGFRGMITTIIPGKTPCLACFSPGEIKGKGVFGALPGIIANFQVLETVKLITGHPPRLAGKLMLFRGEDMSIRTYDIDKNPSCPVCSNVNRSV